MIIKAEFHNLKASQKLAFFEAKGEWGMTHFIDEKNVYHIQKNGKDVLTIELDSIEGHVIIKNEKEVFAGPIDLLSFAN